MRRGRRVLDLLTGAVLAVVALLAGLLAAPLRPITALAIAGGVLIVLVAFWSLRGERGEGNTSTLPEAPQIHSPFRATYEPNGGPGPLPIHSLGQRKDDDEQDDTRRTR